MTRQSGKGTTVNVPRRKGPCPKVSSFFVRGGAKDKLFKHDIERAPPPLPGGSLNIKTRGGTCRETKTALRLNSFFNRGGERVSSCDYDYGFVPTSLFLWFSLNSN